MTTINEQFGQFADLQKQAFEPLRAFSGVAAQAFERVARQNYEVLGDYIEYTVAQARLAGEAQDANDFVGLQIARNRVFVEKMAQRAQEYASIASATQKEATAVAQAEAEKVQAAATPK